jgi:hypothetical protein
LIKKLETQIVWIFGAARSGTTWIAHDLLGSLPSTKRPTGDTGNRPMDEAGFGFLLDSLSIEPEDMFILNDPYQLDASKQFSCSLFRRI